VAAQTFILIDGYNLIFAAEKIESFKRQFPHFEESTLEEKRSFLENYALNFAGHYSAIPVVFYDGKGPAGQTREKHGMIIRFSSANETADQLMEAYLTQMNDKDSCYLVTSDRAIKNFANKFFHRRITPAEFWTESLGSEVAGSSVFVPRSSDKVSLADSLDHKTKKDLDRLRNS